ncbi:MAG TPA: hypothetical protein VF123_14245 [Candidatus Sulfotelmatobacter sp.]
MITEYFACKVLKLRWIIYSPTQIFFGSFPPKSSKDGAWSIRAKSDARKVLISQALQVKSCFQRTYLMARMPRSVPLGNAMIGD